MKDLLYYFAMLIVFLAAFFGHDFFGVSSTIKVFFITEFAASLIAGIHVFSINWKKNAPEFLNKKSKLDHFAIVYAFFFLWAGIILVQNNHIFPFITFLASSIVKGAQINKMDATSVEFAQIMKKYLVLPLGLAVTMMTLMFGSIFFCKSFLQACTGNSLFGIVYYGVIIVLTVFVFKNPKIRLLPAKS